MSRECLPNLLRDPECVRNSQTVRQTNEVHCVQGGSVIVVVMLYLTVTSGQRNLTQGRIAVARGGLIVFARLRPMCTASYTRFRGLLHVLNGISIGSAFFCTAHTDSPYALR